MYRRHIFSSQPQAEQTRPRPLQALRDSTPVGWRDEQPLVGAEKGFRRGVLSWDSIYVLLLSSKHVCRRGGAAEEGSGLPPKPFLQVPAHSLHPPQLLGEMTVRGEVTSAPGLSPTTTGLSPESPPCLGSPLKYLSPSTLLLFFHFIFRSAAPVSSFLFVFGSYYSWLLPLFWFPSSALIRMFILPPCFYTFPKVPPGCSRAEVCVWTGQTLSHGWTGSSFWTATRGNGAAPGQEKTRVLSPAFLPALFLTRASQGCQRQAERSPHLAQLVYE